MHRFVENKLKRILAYVLAGVGATAQAVGLRRYYKMFIAHLVRRTGFFDEVYYRRNNPDVVAKGMAPLWHYVAYGDKEQRQPMPLFDPGYYRRSAGRRLPVLINTVLHYTLIGRYRGFATSPWFDTAHYLATNRDVKFSGMDPLLHFLHHGGRENRAPCAPFNAAQYVLSHPDVAEAGDNPLLHYLGQVPSNGDSHQKHCNGRIRPTSPGIDQWAALPAKKKTPSPVVDVIVPVYEGRNETLCCLFNVLRFRQMTPFELVVIDDASPDPVLSSRLRELAGTAGFTFLKNKTNIGYIRTVNRAMNMHSDRDVVLLNADTEPCNDWLDRLRAVARSDDCIGTVTPLSNNATICSYPEFDRDNPCPLELSSAQLDRLAATVNAGLVVETPTAIGFCMYIKRQCLDANGLFDASAFGRGYGEENDFCQRASKNHWKHVIAPQIFVWHWGSRSFQGAKGKRVRKGLKILAKRYPRYRADIRSFVTEDPLLVARRRLDDARLRRQMAARNVLVVTHNRGGGTACSVREQVKRLRRKGLGVFFLTPTGEKGLARITSVEASHLPNLDSVDFQVPERFAALLRRYRISRIQVHQLIDLHPAAGPVIADRAKQAEVPLEVFIHDYQAVCPHINMVDWAGVFCGQPDEQACRDCLRKRAPITQKTNVVDIAVWRHGYARLFTAAASVYVPDKDVRDRMRQWFPESHMTVVPPQSPFPVGLPPAVTEIESGQALRIVVVGAIVPIKGFDVLLSCAKDVQQRHLPLSFSVMGYTKNDRQLKRLGVMVTGRYRDRDGVRTLRSLQPHLVWLPSIWPETYSYTLSLSLSAGYDIAAFDIGAIARRLRSAGQADYLHPLDWARQPQRINDAFTRYRNAKFSAEHARLPTQTFPAMPRWHGDDDTECRPGRQTW